MARASFVESLTGSLPADLRRVFRAVADYFFENLRIGVPADATRSENLQLYFFSTVTPAVANTEFAIAHRTARVPYLLLPVLSLSAVNEQAIPLQVSRAADATYVYLKSTSTNAAIRIAIEVP